MIERSQEEIDDVLNKAHAAIDEGSKYPGASYEEGLVAMYEWLTEEEPEGNPMQ